MNYFMFPATFMIFFVIGVAYSNLIFLRTEKKDMI